MASNGEIDQLIMLTDELTTIIPDDGKPHSLLEPPIPAYTDMTLRRAYIVWLHCGKINEFKQVCAYFHRLEAMEEELPMEERVKSRLLEYNLMASQPPTSMFLNSYFPNLYRQHKNNDVDPLEDSKFNGCVFNLEGYHKLHVDTGMTQTKILEASHTIRKYCREHSKSLRWLLMQFHDFTQKCDVKNSVNNIVMFIMKKLLKDEIRMNINIPKDFNFLDIVAVPTTSETEVDENPAIDAKKDSNVIESDNNTKKNEEKEEAEKESKVLPEVQTKKYNFKNIISWKIADDQKCNSKYESWMESFIIYNYLR
ncbi:unnamed protein product [Arctia plantaginis]|uniref:Uncharacterized protein n=1 Tax=Arctia plantaginis TaxID=874455 RepID=A0A8S1BJR9_ARCPL|nr:unnamed protein product [Arctia plantaginis]